jgi:plastocyanin
MKSGFTWFMMVAAATILGCSSSSTGPSNGGGGGAAGTVTIGNIFFQSGHNGTKNPAVDTVAVGTTVTWTWTNTGTTPHSVESEDSPSFTSSAIQTGNGKTYSLAFTSPGTYQYDCAVHGSAMTGTLVVQ